MTVRDLMIVSVAAVLSVAMTVPAAAQDIASDVVELQDKAFKKYWNADFEWRFDKLPATVKVAESRTPYSGYIYPDRGGGTVNALRKYEHAFGNHGLVTSFELRDVSQTGPLTEPRQVMRGFGRFRRMVTRNRRGRIGVPHWHGHCNGWTAAAIRHAEPQKSVVRNGVTFTPSDIKALLAEIYIYNENEMLDYQWINPGALHAILGNWLGRGGHPIGVEADPGKEKWNYPIYAYKVKAYNRGANYVDVQTHITYANNIEQEVDKAPRKPVEKYFNYRLHLGADGRITGGYYYRNSAQIDMLWIPVSPKKGGTKGNERGNPYINIEEVLAIWRESVPAEIRANWPHVDPVKADQLADDAKLNFLRPANRIATITSEESNSLASSED